MNPSQVRPSRLASLSGQDEEEEEDAVEKEEEDTVEEDAEEEEEDAVDDAVVQGEGESNLHMRARKKGSQERRRPRRTMSTIRVARCSESKERGKNDFTVGWNGKKSTHSICRQKPERQSE